MYDSFCDIDIVLIAYFLCVDDQIIQEQTQDLIQRVTSNDDVRFYFHPSSYLIDSNEYIYDYPLPQYYHIRILIDPCRNNSYDCCMSVFGSPEYPALLDPTVEAERVYKPYVIASDTEVQKNYEMITEDGVVLPQTQIRSADDYSIWDDRCISLNNPFTNCSVSITTFMS